MALGFSLETIDLTLISRVSRWIMISRVFIHKTKLCCKFYLFCFFYATIERIKRGKMLDIFVTSRVRRKIIVVFAKYPDFKTHVRGLAKLIKEDPGNIQRELTRMTEGQFLIMTKKGNTRIYQTNKQFPILKELQSIVIKSQKGSKPSKMIG